MDKGVIFKTGTALEGIHPKVKYGIWIFRHVLNDIAGVRCVVTSMWDGIHMQNSFHHYGMAADVRSNEIVSRPMKTRVLERVRELLGSEYDVVLEAPGHPNEHFHLEWEAGRPLRERWLAYVLLGGEPPSLED